MTRKEEIAVQIVGLAFVAIVLNLALRGNHLTLPVVVIGLPAVGFFAAIMGAFRP